VEVHPRLLASASRRLHDLDALQLEEANQPSNQPTDKAANQATSRPAIKQASHPASQPGTTTSTTIIRFPGTTGSRPSALRASDSIG
jgi:hypothetical protein